MAYLPVSEPKNPTNSIERGCVRALFSDRCTSCGRKYLSGSGGDRWLMVRERSPFPRLAAGGTEWGVCNSCADPRGSSYQYLPLPVDCERPVLELIVRSLGEYSVSDFESHTLDVEPNLDEPSHGVVVPILNRLMFHPYGVHLACFGQDENPSWTAKLAKLWVDMWAEDSDGFQAFSEWRRNLGNWKQMPEKVTIGNWLLYLPEGETKAAVVQLDPETGLPTQAEDVVAALQCLPAYGEVS